MNYVVFTLAGVIDGPLHCNIQWTNKRLGTVDIKI